MKKHLEEINCKILTLDALSFKVKGWKKQKQKVVFTNGCFDILHRGHIEYLAKAAQTGDKFIVAVNSDDSVKTLQKGDSRPIQDEHSRALIIAALTFVDAVIIFNENTPLHLISTLIPHVLIKGGDYDPLVTDNSNKKYIVGSDVVKKNGGEVKVIPFIKGYSTSKIEAKIKSA